MYLKAAGEQDEERCHSVWSQADKADKAGFLKRLFSRARERNTP